MIIIFCLSITLANLLVLQFGPQSLIFTGFFLIPLDMIIRDHLHDKWHKTFGGLFLKMSGLILAGSLISFFINGDSKNIAIASFVTFMLAGVVDFIVYHLLLHKPKLIKMNISNGCSALADSFLFPIIAFGLIDPVLIFSQFFAKTIGALFWSILFIRRNNAINKSI